MGTSPAQAITTSGSPSSLLAKCQVPMPVVQWRDGGVHVEPVRRGLFAGDDQIDVVAAAQAVIGDREQAVGVRREIDADDFGFLVGDVIDEAGVLMREAVVILAPDVRREQIVERGDGLAPGNFARGLQPLGVLVEHGIDDVDEGFVAGEQAVAAGEQIAFEPALAHVLAENFHHAAVGGEIFVDGKRCGFPGFAGDFVEGFEAVGSGFVGAEDAEIAWCRGCTSSLRADICRGCEWLR